MAIKFKDIKEEQTIKYDNYGIEIDFIINTKMVDNIQEIQEKQQKQMIKKMNLKLNSKGVNKKNNEDILKFAENLDLSELIENTEKNPFEEIVYLIDDLNQSEIKEHFNNNYGVIGSVRYTNFINEIVELILNYIHGEQTPR